MIDIHCHRPSAGFPPDGQSAAPIQRVVQWDVSEPQPPEAEMYAAGLHPWHIPDSREDVDKALMRLRSMAERPDVWFVGEAGLDSMRQRFVSDAAFAAQPEVFAEQAFLAEQLHKPLLLHVVRRYDEVLQLRRKMRPMAPWVLHGFSKGPGLLRQLTDAGLHVSFGAALLQDGPVAEAWQSADLQRVFLETDDSGISLRLLYERAALLRRMPVETLEAQMMENFSQLTDI